MPGRTETSRFTTAELRHAYLLDDLFAPGEVRLVYTDLDRAIVGAACPTEQALALSGGTQLRSDFFCQRRELGILNLGAPGTVDVDGTAYPLGKCDCLYVGRGSVKISFSSKDPEHPAAFYLVSYPAHTAYPTAKATPAEANVVRLGTKAEANERVLHQYIHEQGIKSCQLVMGFTALAPGSVWNTMPPHTHERRSEVYCYYDLPAGNLVLHMMGGPQETRPLWIGNLQVALSPSWSVHCGAGTSHYRFVWAMGGENQRFDDMDKFPITDLR
jgi:4-deoxy-L-threo-5-hexosulose-uronate ketol-isomerase